ncbi:MAG: ABC transporter substrate binding protein [Chloroflexota bacterium]|nr:ABC transporter substrate binding protein [Chloroflexota bacterium]MDE2910502.1 ABC transporter substrate binding protein [Chloroflexota bacterium]
MRARILIGFVMLALLLTAPGLAQDDEKPTIAMMNFGYSAGQTLATKGAFDVLQAYGYFNEEERAVLDEGEDLVGENINVLWRNAGSDTPTANLMVEDGLDRGVDAMLIVTTQVTQIAVNATRDMEDPPAIMFSLVGSPYFAGIADAPCIKPDHVGGSQYHLPYAQSVAVMQLWNPDIKTVGMIVAPAEPISVSGARSLQQAAEDLGLTVEVATVVTLSDLNLAAEALVNRGVEALINPISSIILSGTTLLQTLTAEYGIPLFGIFPYHVYNGATVAAGFNNVYGEGVIQGRMLVAHLNGDVDISETRINQTRDFGIAINLDSAEAQGVEIPEALLAMADFVIEDGVSSASATRELPEVVTTLPDMSIEERRAADLAFLDTLRCTEKMIAEQRAEIEDTWAED